MMTRTGVVPDARPGTQVDCRLTKWGGGRHWEYAGTWLGSDEHGVWLGFRAGTVFRRPGAEYVAPFDQVGLVPPGAHWLATFHAAPSPVAVYVDVATPARWSGSGERPVLEAVDLDLDVLRSPSGRVWVDDEDEFAAHRVRLGYPEDLVVAALSSCEHLVGRLTEQEPPFDGSHQRWFGHPDR